MKPMMWMGRVSGWAALGMGALFATAAAFELSAGVVEWTAMLAGALLLTGSWRTLRRESGGLRLLCGAWGFAAGLLSPIFQPSTPPSSWELALHDTYYVMSQHGWLPALVFALCLTGLALTVLHKEK